MICWSLQHRHEYKKKKNLGGSSSSCSCSQADSVEPLFPATPESVSAPRRRRAECAVSAPPSSPAPSPEDLLVVVLQC
uniref:Uncharacterized protein n=1 Tax=Physcomitrium patens TaxID=3218 RepID=A0A2K1L830_PHYPA|nr:hypothetical protein PHYPA_000575 [Physcomitrium patens]